MIRPDTDRATIGSSTPPSPLSSSRTRPSAPSATQSRRRAGHRRDRSGDGGASRDRRDMRIEWGLDARGYTEHTRTRTRYQGARGVRRRRRHRLLLNLRADALPHTNQPCNNSTAPPQAREVYGDAAVTVYSSTFKPMHFALCDEAAKKPMAMKLVCAGKCAALAWNVKIPPRRWRRSSCAQVHHPTTALHKHARSASTHDPRAGAAHPHDLFPSKI